MANRHMRPCNVRHEGAWYHCHATGIVTEGKGTEGAPVDPILEKRVKETIARLRRNKSARLRNQTYRDLGLTRTPYGWE
jgi:hypothetical protein